MYGPRLLQQRVKFSSFLYWRELALEVTGRANAGAASQGPVPEQEKLLHAGSPPACLKLPFSLSPGRRESTV